MTNEEILKNMCGCNTCKRILSESEVGSAESFWERMFWDQHDQLQKLLSSPHESGVMEEVFIEGAIAGKDWDVGTTSKGRSFGMYCKDKFAALLSRRKEE